MTSLVVITPIWKPALHSEEEQALEISIRQSSRVSHVFLAPHSLDTSWYQSRFPGSRLERMEEAHFNSVHSYSRLLITSAFYRQFDKFEFMVVCQTDAILIKDPSDIDTSNIDYIGAPWSPPLKYIHLGKQLYVSSSFGETNESKLVQTFGRRLCVGNGGLSLRRTESLIKATEAIQSKVSHRTRQHVLEDALICSMGPKCGLRIASQERAESIFMESQAAGLHHFPDVFGFHGLERWNPELLTRILESDGKQLD